MRETILIIPGVRDSGPAYWQTWFESQIPDARRVTGIDWHRPVLANWAGAIGREIHAVLGNVWLIAHSFGCLATVVAAAEHTGKVAGLMLVAPADPERFTALGHRQPARSDDAAEPESLSSLLPQARLGIASVLVASCNDPCARLLTSTYWAQRWGSRFIGVGNAGHINVASGHGPWPQGLEIFNSLRERQGGVPLGTITLQREGTHA